MNRIKGFVANHYTAIIIVLFVLFLLKSCQCTTRKSTIAFNKANYESCVDSLRNEIAVRDSAILVLANDVDKLKIEREYLQQNNNTLRSNNENMQSRERELVKTILNNSKNK